MNHSDLNRRHFIQRTAAIAGAALAPAALWAQNAPAKKRTAADQVPLGKTGLFASRLGMGVGSNSGQVQRDMGHDAFNAMVRHAYDRGITLIDTAQSYSTHEWVREAIKGLPREKFFIQTKISGAPDKPLEVIDRFRKELNSDYIDSVLVHCMTRPTWSDDMKRVMDAISEAKEKKIIRAKGASCHGLPGLTCATRTTWNEVHLVRLNPQGRHTDGHSDNWDVSGTLETLPIVVKEIKSMREQGRGIVGMKIIGNGEFTKPEDREKSIRYAAQCGLLDAMVIGFASIAQVDEAIERLDRALAEA